MAAAKNTILEGKIETDCDGEWNFSLTVVSAKANYPYTYDDGAELVFVLP